MVAWTVWTSKNGGSIPILNEHSQPLGLSVRKRLLLADAWQRTRGHTRRQTVPAAPSVPGKSAARAFLSPPAHSRGTLQPYSPDMQSTLVGAWALDSTLPCLHCSSEGVPATHRALRRGLHID